jgi:hypothetical protein
MQPFVTSAMRENRSRVIQALMPLPDARVRRDNRIGSRARITHACANEKILLLALAHFNRPNETHSP